MKIYDISLEISESMAVYKNKEEKKPKISITRTMKEGSNESRLELESHTGTHADAPYHMLRSGKTIEKIPLEKFFGKCAVLDFTKAKGSIGKKDLEKKKSKIRKDFIILLKTKNRQLESFDVNFVYLEKTGAEFLAAKKVKAVGIDSLGVERSQPNHETHEILLEKNMKK